MQLTSIQKSNYINLIIPYFGNPSHHKFFFVILTHFYNIKHPPMLS